MAIHPLRLLRYTLKTLLLLEVLYLISMNTLLNTEVVPTQISRRPERLLISYENAWTLWPGRVHVTGLHIRAQGPGVQWYIRADYAYGNIQVLKLMGRQFHAGDVSAGGVSFWMRSLGRKGDTTLREAIPDIPGLRYPLDSDSPRTSSTIDNPWDIQLDGMDVSQINELWLEEYHFVGHASASGNLSVIPRHHVAVTDGRLDLLSGGVLLGNATVVDDLQAAIHFSLDGVDPTQLDGRDILEYLSTQTNFHAHNMSLDFMNYYFRSTPWFTIAEGKGDVEANIEVMRGALQEGSNLKVAATEAVVDLGAYQVSGTVEIGLDVATEYNLPMCSMGMFFSEFALYNTGELEPLATGKGLMVGAQSPDLQLNDPFTTLDMSIHLPDSEVPHLRVLNTYLPQSTGLTIGEGSGHLNGDLQLSTRDRSIVGTFTVAGSPVALTYEGLEMKLDMVLRAQLHCENDEHRRCHLEGSRLALDHVNINDVDPGAGRDLRGWWGHLTVTQGYVQLDDSPHLDTYIETSMRDSAPLISLFTEKTNLPGWVQKVLSLEDITGTAHLIVEPAEITFKELSLSGPGVQLHARIHRDTNTSAILFVKTGRLAVGLELDAGQTRVKLVNAEQWFEGHQ